MLDFEDFKREYQKVPVEEYPNNVLEAVPEPMVSVQISTYQHVDFIRDCLDGVLMQETDFPIEILVGEDESDDGTREICKEYADRYPDKIRLFLHRRENNIKIHGRPTGRFQSTYTRFKCRGKYIAICEGDDYWTDPKKLQKQVAYLESNEDFVVSCHDAKVIGKSGKLISKSKLSDRKKGNLSEEDLLKGKLVLTLSMCLKNIISEYPKEYFEVLNGDIFIISMLGEFGKAKFMSEIQPAAYRKHEKGAWSMKSKIYTTKQYENTMIKLSKYHSRKGRQNIAEDLYGRGMWCYRNLCRIQSEEGKLIKSTKSYLKYIYLCMKAGEIRLIIGTLLETLR